MIPKWYVYIFWVIHVNCHHMWWQELSITKKKLKDLHDSNLNNKEILFTYCGNLPFNTVYNSIETFCTKLKERNKKTLSSKKQIMSFGKKVFINFDREQTQIFLGIPSGKLGSKDTIIWPWPLNCSWPPDRTSGSWLQQRTKGGLCQKSLASSNKWPSTSATKS